MTFPQNFPLTRTSELSVYGRCAAVCAVQSLPTKPCFGSPGSRRKLNTLYLVQSCVFSGTFTCGTSHGSNVLICQPDMTDGKRMMPRPKKPVKVCSMWHCVFIRCARHWKVLFFDFVTPSTSKTTWLTFLLAKLWLANHFIRYSNITLKNKIKKLTFPDGQHFFWT